MGRGRGRGRGATLTIEAMQQLLYKLVERMLLQHGALSRNRNFEVFNDPRLRGATRIVRHLRALERDLLRFGAHDLQRDPDGRWRLAISMPPLGAQRLALLSEHELQLLCLHPEVAAALSPWRKPFQPHNDENDDA
jgi:hypothetical protein